MRKLLAMLLAVTALIGLSACGSKTDATAPQAPTVYDGNSGTNGTGANGSPSPENNPEGRTLMPSGGAFDQAIEPTEESIGTPYDEMLQNGYVHDSDGILSDGENSMS